MPHLAIAFSGKTNTPLVRIVAVSHSVHTYLKSYILHQRHLFRCFVSKRKRQYRIVDGQNLKLRCSSHKPTLPFLVYTKTKHFKTYKDSKVPHLLVHGTVKSSMKNSSEQTCNASIGSRTRTPSESDVFSTDGLYKAIVQSNGLLNDFPVVEWSFNEDCSPSPPPSIGGVKRQLKCLGFHHHHHEQRDFEKHLEDFVLYSPKARPLKRRGMVRSMALDLASLSKTTQEELVV